jgi:hypothetical protein
MRLQQNPLDRSQMGNLINSNETACDWNVETKHTPHVHPHASDSAPQRSDGGSRRRRGMRDLPRKQSGWVWHGWGAGVAWHLWSGMGMGWIRSEIGSDGGGNRYGE